MSDSRRSCLRMMEKTGAVLRIVSMEEIGLAMVHEVGVHRLEFVEFVGDRPRRWV